VLKMERVVSTEQLKTIRRYKKKLRKERKRDRLKQERIELCQQRLLRKFDDTKHKDKKKSPLNNDKKDASSQTQHQTSIIMAPDSRGKSLLRVAIGLKSKAERRILPEVRKRACVVPPHYNEVLDEKRSKKPVVRELDPTLLASKNNKFLGSGTFSKCFAARYRDISVTVKQYHDCDNTSISTLQKSAQREAEMVLALDDHPGVPFLFGLCSISKPVRLILLFHGDKTNNTSETISSATKKKPPLDSKWWCNIVRLTAVALKHIHNCGIIHNDLKGNNVVLEPNLNPNLPKVAISFHSRQWYNLLTHDVIPAIYLIVSLKPFPVNPLKNLSIIITEYTYQ